MSGISVRQHYMRAFRGLQGSTRWICAAVVLGYVGCIAGSMIAGYWILQYPIDPYNGLALAAIVLFIGTRLRGLNNIVHECTHYTFATKRPDNLFFGRLCAALILSSFHHYRADHMSHHAHVGDYEKDEDLKAIRRFRLEAPLTTATVLRHLVTPLTGLHLPYYLKVDLSAEDGSVFLTLKIGLIVAALGTLALDPIASLVLVWAPFVLAFSAINYWTDCIDHGGLVGEHDELQASRNMIVPQPLRAILFPRNDCFHLVHHLFPQVPARHLDTCHEMLLAHPAYRARQGLSDKVAHGPAVDEAATAPSA